MLTCTLNDDVRKIMNAMCQLTDLEWSAFGTIEISSDKAGRISSLNVDKILFVKQECTPARTEMDDDAVCDLLSRAYEDGYGDRMKCWIHSHANMDVFWSSQDETCIEGLCKDLLLSVVINKAGDMLARVDVGIPFRYTINDVPIVTSYGDDVEEFCKRTIKEKIKKGKVVSPKRRRLKGYKNPYFEEIGNPKGGPWWIEDLIDKEI